MDKEKIKMYQVDAFTDTLFSGNPAAVCILDKWLDDELMQSIALENNLAETAFVVSKGKEFEIRWFTPTVEVDLCGHATLAAGFVLFDQHRYPDSKIQFYSLRSGLLPVERNQEWIILDFPSDPIQPLPVEYFAIMEKCIGMKVLGVYKGKSDYIALVENEKCLQNLQANFNEIAKLDARGLVVSAKGDNVDFVSRFFAPQSGIDEDPVTGSAHTSLTPLWATKLNKTKMIARQLSKRGGYLQCEYQGERCLIAGQAKLYLMGEINLI